MHWMQPMNEFPKEQAQTLWLIRSQPFSIDTYPNLRQATTQDFRLATNLIFQPQTLGGLNGRNSYLG